MIESMGFGVIATSNRFFLVAWVSAIVTAHADRRVVDRITIGDVRAEQAHGYAGAEVASGIAGGRAFRETRGWLRYALTIFDDTEVTLSCTFLGSDTPRTFDLVVENRRVASYTFRSGTTTTVDLQVPLEITKG